MIIFPAIDIKDNKCVRLSQGKFENVNIYSDSPVDMAKKWESMGAEYIHVVDLDGAKDQSFKNRKAIEKIVKSVRIPIQTGGGIRDKDRVKELINIGVKRTIIGTMAIENQELLRALAKEYKEYLAVSIDASNGNVATRGWMNIEGIKGIDLCKFLEDIGIETVVYTDISKDGMLMGPNFSIYEKLIRETNLNIIASGGVTSISDIEKLNEMNIYGAIVGKALYENKIKLEDAIKVAKKINK